MADMETSGMRMETFEQVEEIISGVEQALNQE